MGTAKEEDKSSVGERKNKMEEEKNRTQGLVGQELYEKREERTYRKRREGKISRGRYLEEKRKWKEYLEERREKKKKEQELRKLKKEKNIWRYIKRKGGRIEE